LKVQQDENIKGKLKVDRIVIMGNVVSGHQLLKKILNTRSDGVRRVKEQV
jgi:hypothetical protein